ncbi:hypothetical protein IAU60_003268 [Kwoniella sp. DSM 27419]
MAEILSSVTLGSTQTDSGSTLLKEESHPPALWALPAKITARQVLPDRYTDPASLAPEQMKGKESNPSRMGVYVCLLDERPHLHPSLLALDRHRLAAHQIPLPTDPSTQISQRSSQVGTSDKAKDEWFMWSFSEEEESRRRSFLPLA